MPTRAIRLACGDFGNSCAVRKRNLFLLKASPIPPIHLASRTQEIAKNGKGWIMSDSYIPTPDGLALTWMQSFASGISGNVAAYQLSAADAANISGVVADFASAYAVAATNSTRTPVTIALKDEKRVIAEQLCRQYAIGIKFNIGISDADKIAI